MIHGWVSTVHGHCTTHDLYRLYLIIVKTHVMQSNILTCMQQPSIHCYYETVVKLTAVNRFSSCVIRAILVQLKCFAVDRRDGATIAEVGLFRKYRLNRVLSLRTGDPEEYDIWNETLP